MEPWEVLIQVCNNLTFEIFMYTISNLGELMLQKQFFHEKCLINDNDVQYDQLINYIENSIKKSLFFVD